MKQKRVVVVGAGVAGLVAAVYAREAGHNVTVLEQGLKAGGLSSNWRRRKYHFEGGLHWLLGSSPKMKTLYDCWVEVGGLSASNPVNVEDPAIVLYHGRNKLPYYRNTKAFRDELLNRSPKDKEAIERLCSDISLFVLFMDPDGGVRAVARQIMMAVPFAVRCLQLWRISTQEYVCGFGNAEIRSLLKTIINPAHMALALIYTMAAYSMGDCGYPQGGSLVMTANLLERATGEGSRILYRQNVSEVVIEKGQVRGVVSNGDFFEADEVIVTVDTRKALETLFRNVPIEEKWARDMKKNLVNQQCMFITLGIRADLFRYPMNMRILLDRPITVGGEVFDCLEVYNYAEHEGYAPYKCTALTVILRADSYDYWKQARGNDTYLEKKRMALSTVIEALKEQIPEIDGNIEVEEMATPLTYEFYTASFRGGWMSILKPGKLPHVVPIRCRSVRGLHFAGERTMLAGGLPSALLSGKAAAKAIRSR